MKPYDSTVTWLLLFTNAVILKLGFLVNENWYFAMIISLPMLAVQMQRNRVHTRLQQELDAEHVFLNQTSLN